MSAINVLCAQLTRDLFAIAKFLLPAGLRVAQPCRYCFYSVVQKWVFRPERATRCPDKREIWQGESGPYVPHAKFHVYRRRNVGIQPAKLLKFRILAINFLLSATRLQFFYEFLSVCTRL